jgi:putative zinc finger/helix-turn-helix YgiT family protein
MTDNRLNSVATPAAEDVLRCPACGDHDVSTTSTEDSFTYGVGRDAVLLTVVVPVRACAKCGHQFLDDEAEDIRHAAVCRHLGVMNPAAILALREKYGMSRAEFARITRLDEATLGRWERGALIQSGAIDQLLYLLGFEENWQRLRERVDGTPDNKVSGAAAVSVSPR